MSQILLNHLYTVRDLDYVAIGALQIMHYLTSSSPLSLHYGLIL